jgi:hypothetical protein
MYFILYIHLTSGQDSGLPAERKKGQRQGKPQHSVGYEREKDLQDKLCFLSQSREEGSRGRWAGVWERGG